MATTELGFDSRYGLLNTQTNYPLPLPLPISIKPLPILFKSSAHITSLQLHSLLLAAKHASPDNKEIALTTSGQLFREPAYMEMLGELFNKFQLHNFSNKWASPPLAPSIISNFHLPIRPLVIPFTFSISGIGTF